MHPVHDIGGWSAECVPWGAFRFFFFGRPMQVRGAVIYSPKIIDNVKPRRRYAYTR